MKRFIQSILVFLVLAFASGCSKSSVLSPREFTDEFADAMRKATLGAKVKIVKDLQVEVTAADGYQTTSFLDNAYSVYQQDPKSKDKVIRMYVGNGLRRTSEPKLSDVVDTTLIVPVIKDRPWLGEMRKVLGGSKGTNSFEFVQDDFNSELVIVYAEDSPVKIRYLAATDLQKLHMNQGDLKNLARENLRRLLPPIERRGGNGIFIISAGGSYEASLLLLNSVVSELQSNVQGDLVVAIPARDVLAATGSQDREGIKKVKEIVQIATEGGAYRLTTKLFVYRNDKFEEFKE